MHPIRKGDANSERRLLFVCHAVEYRLMYQCCEGFHPLMLIEIKLGAKGGILGITFEKRMLHHPDAVLRGRIAPIASPRFSGKG